MCGCTCYNTSFPPHFIRFHHFRFGFQLDPPDSSSCTIMICDLLRCKKMQVPGWSVLSPSSPLWNRIPYLHSSRGNWKWISWKHDDDLREAPSLLSVSTEDALRIDVTLRGQCCLSWIFPPLTKHFRMAAHPMFQLFFSLFLMYSFPIPTVAFSTTSNVSYTTSSLPTYPSCLQPDISWDVQASRSHFQTNSVEFLHQETN